MSAWLIRLRFVTFPLVLLVTALLGWLGGTATYEQSISSLFAPNDPDIVAYEAAGRSFGSDNFAFVAYDDPMLLTPEGMARVAELAQAVGPDSIAGIQSVQSLDAMPQLWRIDDLLIQLASANPLARPLLTQALRLGVSAGGQAGARSLSIQAAVAAARTQEARDELRTRLVTNPLFRGTVISDDGRSTAVVVRLRPTTEFDMKATVRQLREAADSFATRHNLGRIAVVGPPVLLADAYTAIETDGRKLAKLGMVLLAGVMLVSVRSLWWIVVPLTVGWGVWWGVEAFLAWRGMKLSLSGGPLMAQVIVLTMPAASHLAILHRLAMQRGDRARPCAQRVLDVVGWPIFWCAISTALGYGVLLTSALVPVRQFGGVLMVCALTTAFLVTVCAPFAMLAPRGLRLQLPESPTRRLSRPAWASILLTESLNGLVKTAARRPAVVLSVLIVGCGPVLVGISRMQYEYNYINSFQPHARVVSDYGFVEGRLGGIGLYQLVVPLEEGITSENIARLSRLDEQLANLELDGLAMTTQVVSLATALDPDGRLGALKPDQTAAALDFKTELILASPQAELLASFWNPETRAARIMVRLIESQQAERKEWAFNRARQLAHEEFGPSCQLTGMSYLLTRTVRSVTSTQWTTLACSGLGVLLMLAVALRSGSLALLGALPTVLSVGLTIGAMGWLGIKVDIATALVASVALGMAVDQTFHSLIQYRRQRQRHGFTRALVAGFRLSGPGITLSSVAVSAGFLALWFSEFVPFSNFGFLISVAIVGGLVGNLVVLPAFLAATLGRRVRLARQRLGRLDDLDLDVAPHAAEAVLTLSNADGFARLEGIRRASHHHSHHARPAESPPVESRETS